MNGPIEEIKHDERMDGTLTFEKAKKIKGDFFWIDFEGRIRVYSKMRELNMETGKISIVN